MMTATVGEIRKNFSRVLKSINTGEKITITKRGVPVACLTALSPEDKIEWPDFYNEAVELKGQPLSDIVIECRKDRF